MAILSADRLSISLFPRLEFLYVITKFNTDGLMKAIKRKYPFTPWQISHFCHFSPPLSWSFMTSFSCFFGGPFFPIPPQCLHTSREFCVLCFSPFLLSWLPAELALLLCLWAWLPEGLTSAWATRDCFCFCAC